MAIRSAKLLTTDLSLYCSPVPLLQRSAVAIHSGSTIDLSPYCILFCIKGSDSSVPRRHRFDCYRLKR